MTFLLFVACLVGLVLCLHCAAMELAKRGVIDYGFRKVSRASLGTALHELNAIARPSMYYTLDTMHVRSELQEHNDQGDDPEHLVVHLPIRL